MPSPRVSKYHRQATALSPRVSKYHRQAIALHLTTGVIKEASSRIVYITDIFLTMTVTESKVQKQPPGKLTNMIKYTINTTIIKQSSNKHQTQTPVKLSKIRTNKNNIHTDQSRTQSKIHERSCEHSNTIKSTRKTATTIIKCTTCITV